MALTLHLVRHGQSEWNVAGRLQGQTRHPALTDLGRAQAAAAGTRLAELGPIDRLLTSDLLRAEQTAEIIGTAAGLTPVPEPRLREQAMGHLEGLTSAAAFEAASAITWTESVRLGGSASESVRDVAARIGSLLAELITSTEDSVVLVSHGDTIRIAVAWLTSTAADRDFELGPIENGSIITGTVDEGVLVELVTHITLV